MTASGALRTARPLAGYFYEFLLPRSGGHLGVTEIRQKRPGERDSQEDRLALLDGTAAQAWGADLPVRLRELHSHWLSRSAVGEACFLFFRPRRVPGREVQFVAALEKSGGSGSAASSQQASSTGQLLAQLVRSGWMAHAARCMPVPRHLRSHDHVAAAPELAALAARGDKQTGQTGLTDTLVLWKQQPAEALAKFEAAAVTHWFWDAARRSYSVELPRFRLKFALRADGLLHSCDFSGYSLAPQQQLSDTLAGFSQYLVLEPGLQLEQHPPWVAPVKLVVPSGPVARAAGSGAVSVVGDDKPEACRRYCTYDVHRRFGELRARTLPARLQLAALYAAADTGVPEKRSRMTGSERAIALLRACWFVNRPLSEEEEQLYANIAEHTRATPALRLLCHHQRASSRQLAFLHPASSGAAELESSAAGGCAADTLADSITEYLAYVQRGACNPRRLLTPAEEVRVMGMRAAPQEPAPRRLPRTSAPIARLLPPPVSAACVAEAEARLQAMVAITPRSGKGRPFPLAPAAGEAMEDALSEDTWGDLRSSWTVHDSLPAQELMPALRENPQALQPALGAELAAATQRRAAAEKYLMAAMAAEPEAWEAPGWQAAGNGGIVIAHRLRAVAGRVPLPTVQDMLRSLWDPSVVEGLNIFVGLSEADRAQVREGVLAWAQLAVLEDRLTRLHHAAKAAAAPAEGAADPKSALLDIAKELQVTRTWEAHRHPLWLVFEVDGALQIRPAQHSVARELLENAGGVAQLNMGCGPCSPPFNILRCPSAVLRRAPRAASCRLREPRRKAAAAAGRERRASSCQCCCWSGRGIRRRALGGSCG